METLADATESERDLVSLSAAKRGEWCSRFRGKLRISPQTNFGNDSEAPETV